MTDGINTEREHWSALAQPSRGGSRSVDLTGWLTVEVPVPDDLGERITAQQMREVLKAHGLGQDDGSVLGDWFGAVCDAVELTEWHPVQWAPRIPYQEQM